MGVNLPRRSIPACAGEPGTFTAPCNVQRAGSIPACAGEPAAPHGLVATPTGLSPRVRGNRYSSRMARANPGTSVYPRVCGGTAVTRVSMAAVHGSIPACAGEPVGRFAAPLARGSIPACAGEPNAVSEGAEGYSLRGLSPRVRGNHGSADRAADGSGSIPACAGEPTR